MTEEKKEKINSETLIAKDEKKDSLDDNIVSVNTSNDEVAELYKTVPIGTKVTIVDGVYRNFGKGFRDLKSGMYGADVMEIQKKLKELGFFVRKS